MCGIVGHYAIHGGVEPDRIRRMADCLRHRGPDDEGMYLNPRKTVGLGHRRLSIIDLSPAGHQPMSNEDGTVWIVFNGEIYNFHELREELQHKGHTFRSQTDTETIIHLYEEYGTQCLERLRGMFAFAIWDEKQEQLFLARDRVGKKPLKYYFDGSQLFFASELKALLANREIPRDIDEQAIHHYLTLQYVPHPLTGFQKIAKLPPAHFLLLKNGKLTVQKYWQLSYTQKQPYKEEEWKERIRSALEEAVRLRLIADVPLGAFLSGGVDSSAVVAMMAKHTNGKVKTFSIGFESEQHNELPKARLIAERFGTEHTEFMVKPDALDIFEKLVAHYEEPYADSSAIPTYYVSKLTREHVTVALNGDGGDESFAGYPWYAVQKLASRFDRVPAGIRGALVGGLLSPLLRLRPSTSRRRAWLAAATFGESSGRRYARYFTSSYFSEREKYAMYTDAFRERMNEADTPGLIDALYRATLAEDPVDRAMATDVESYLPDDLLVKVDLAAMMHSLEARSPFLDHRLMELAASIPAGLKLRGYRLKYLLKESLRPILPPEILDAPKHGFTVPLGEWFRTAFVPLVHERLLAPDARIHTYIRHDAIERLFREHQTGRIDHGSRLWALLTLEQWLRTFFS